MRFSTFLPVAGVVAIVAPALATPAVSEQPSEIVSREDSGELLSRNIPGVTHSGSHYHYAQGAAGGHHGHRHHQPRGDIEEFAARGVPISRPTHSPSGSGKPTGHHRREYFDVQDIFARGVPMGRPTHPPSGSGKPVRHHVRSYEYSSGASPYYHHYYHHHHARNEPSLELLARAILDEIELD